MYAHEHTRFDAHQQMENIWIIHLYIYINCTHRLLLFNDGIFSANLGNFAETKRIIRGAAAETRQRVFFCGKCGVRLQKRKIKIKIHEVWGAGSEKCGHGEGALRLRLREKCCS